jgi:hypothetical protein
MIDPTKDETPSLALLNHIVDLISRPIPKPAKQIARTQASWRTLKLDQRLTLRQRWFAPGMDLPPGTEVTISKVDSLGISLTHNSDSGILRWTNPNWKVMFEKTGKRRKKSDPAD